LIELAFETARGFTIERRIIIGPSLGDRLNVADHRSLWPSHASDFLEIGEP